MGNVQSSSRTLPQGHAEEEGTLTLSQNSSTDAPMLEDRYFNPTRSRFSQSRHSILGESWRRQSQRSSADANYSSDQRSYDQIDERPFLTEPDDPPLFSSNHDPPVEPNAERPPNWRHSTMSRLGSRLLPDSVARGLTNSGEETAEEGHALRSGLSSRSRPSVYHRRIESSSDSRFSVTDSLRRRSNLDSAREQPTRNSVRRFFSTHSNPRPAVASSHTNLSFGHQPVAQDEFSQLTPTRGDLRRSSTRLARVRQSLNTSMGSLLGASDRLSSRRLQSTTVRPSTTVFPDDSDELLSHPTAGESRAEVEDTTPHELDAVEPETRNLLSSSRITSGMSTIRRFPHGLRSRSTRLIRRGEHPPLSQVLQLAAAAIAAQLSGNAAGNPESSHSPGEAFDGSIQNFVQTLQEAASAQAGQNIDLDASEGELPPVNFMRVFQFPNDENGTPMAAVPNQASRSADDAAHDNNDRSVTLVLVGVRSMPNVQEGANGENGTLGPSLDTLLSLPFLPPANVLRNGSSGALFRRSDTRVRPQSRRHSMTNFNFPQQYDSQRHARHRTSTRTSTENGLLTPMSESPPGPNPPPSTPADMRSGTATPIRRPSSASAAHGPGLPDLNEDQDHNHAALPAESASNTARQRRRSDSEFARRPELSSGSSRRNGVVEPDGPSPHAGRSWLIYVVGTNVSPDHPAFTMPSLFTDNPSYEDMQMLSTLLGPVKPPVATQEDVEAAGGLFRLLGGPRAGALIAESVNEPYGQIFPLNHGDRCLICLCEYVESEHIRRINTCKHVFHRECIDEWLTTGRNSCPMCRGQGVKENTSEADVPTTRQEEDV